MSNCYHEDVSQYCNCSTILRRFHGLLSEAEELYKESDEMIDCNVAESICAAIENLEQAFRLGGLGEEKENNAYRMLDQSDCSNTCNANSTECLELNNNAQEKFSLESDYLTHALNSLRDAQEDIHNAIEARQIGYKLRDQYKECVHCQNPTSN